MPRRVGIRWVVAALVLAVVTPLTILSAFGIQRSWRRLFANLNRQNIATARAVSVAIDQEVQTTTAALTVLGELHALDIPDLPAFEGLATRLLAYQPTWASIVLTDVDGTILDGVPDRLDGGARVEKGQWAQTTSARRTATVSNLFALPDTPGRFVMMAVPIVRDGRVVRVLGARVHTDAFSAILRRQDAPPNGAVALVDANGNIIARTKDEARLVGTRVTQSFLDFTRRGNEGAWRPGDLDAIVNYGAYSRSPRTGLLTGLSLPASEVEDPLWRLLGILVGVWLLIIGSGAALGFALGGVLIRSLSAASGAAVSLSRDEAVTVRRSRIREIDDMSAGLQSAAETVRARNRERDEAARLKDEFLMTISHELRTPLTAIVGWARMLATGHIHDEQRPGAIAAIERNAIALQQLVNDLLDVSRIVSGKLRLDLQSISLPTVVSAALDTVRPAAQAKGVTLSTDFDKEIAVNGDASRLQQIVWNLLSNAMRFTPAGGRIDVSVARSAGSEGEAEITVRDSGSGIAPEFLPFVFDRFRQQQTGTRRAHGGLGLGLAIVRHLVELHGGTVSAENNVPPPGATFRVRLPLQASKSQSAAAETRAARSPDPPMTRLDNLRLLVVDDDAHARELCVSILENAGARVRTAASAEDALALLATEWPDVLVSDIEMPNQDGYSLLERARELAGAEGHLHAVAVTAHARPDDQARALASGFSCHVAKPFEPAELVNVIALVSSQATNAH